MAFVFSDPQRRILPQIIHALQRFEEDPEQLERERNQLHNDLPPPYSLSGETTQPPSPNLPDLSESDRRWRQRIDILRSAPNEQFKSQSARERERIIIQMEGGRRVRRETVLVDQDLDLLANAENNIRSHWMEQGIWLREWGPAWPKGTKSDIWRAQPEGPEPGRFWGHEKGYEREREQERERERKRKSELNLRKKYNVFSGLRTPEAEEPESAVEDLAGPSEHDTSASRPYHQFLYQIPKEREWIIDEVERRRSTRPVDIEAAAYESVKNNWIKDKIWNPNWGELPGTTWMHEDLIEEDRKEKEVSGKLAGSFDELVHNAAEERRTHHRLPGLSDPLSTSGHGGDNSSSALRRVESSVAGSTGSTKRKSPGSLPEVSGSKQANPSSATPMFRFGEHYDRSIKPKSSKLVEEDGTLLESGDNDGRIPSAAARKSRRKPIPETAKTNPPPLRRSARIAAMNTKSSGRPSKKPQSSTPIRKSSRPRRR